MFAILDFSVCEKMLEDMDEVAEEISLLLLPRHHLVTIDPASHWHDVVAGLETPPGLVKAAVETLCTKGTSRMA